ncbi:uncharacterized protein LOC136082397 [Hydra vulgaris]|uniref:Uncharacterized protein LOC136082397 n=1 Tax=Hydra vulgaris TaxID=6087 RepID=A0ABM4C7R7_HYDVU
MKKENENMAKISKEDVKAAIDASPYPCIIHFDGKTLFELNKGKMLKRDRMAVLVSINGQTYLLGVPPLASSTGEDQFLGVMNLIKEYQLMSKTRGICFDTTSSNTGTNKGSVSRISQELDKYLLQIACRHHVTKLRMLHFWKLVTNEETSGPDNPLFKKLKNIFEEPNFNYNSVLLLRFDWNKVKSSFLEKAAMKSLTFCKAYVSKPGIIRDDRSELAELVVTYLSPITYKVRKTGAIHHARFLGKAIYYLKLRLLSNQLTFVQENDKLKIEIKLITEFIVCFYAKWYLQSEDVIKAPFLDITAINQMHLYKKVCTNPIAVDAVLESQYKHCWYLDSTMIPLALLDDELASEEKAKIASAILSFDMPSSDYYKPENKVKQDIKEIYKMNTKIGKKPPSLSALVDVFSYLIFDMIGFDKQRVQDWLSLPPNYWHTQSCFKSFQKYAETLIFVNDHSERSIGMMGQYIHRYSDETEKHNRLLTVDKVRSVFRSQEQKSGTISKIKFNDGLGVMRKKIKS